MSSPRPSEPQPEKDHWTPSAYTSSASFVPLLTSKILSWLSPHPSDKILDLGCGDGVLTANLRSQHPSLSVTGIDSSPNLVTSAKASYGKTPGLSFAVQDCRYLERWTGFQEGGYDKIFSNAALHWILRDEGTRVGVLENTFKMLKPGGTFTFEMGGAGNVAEVHTALLSTLVHQGISIEKARELSPWFFPSEVQMRNLLEGVGFVVEKMEIEYRPTRLTESEEGGIEGWVRLMGAQFLEGLGGDKEKRERVVREVCEVLRSVISREEGEGGMWLGYVRLRVLARKPE